MNNRLIHFDSNTSTYKNNDPFSAVYAITNPPQHIKSISLKSVEMPVNFSNVRNTGTLNNFSIIISSVIYSIILPDKIYVTIASLLTDINSAFTGVTLPSSSVLTLSVSNNFITASLSTATAFSIKSTQLGDYILGFKRVGSNVITTSSTITGLNQFLLNVDNYITMYLPSIPSATITSANGTYCHFKIPLNCISGVVFYDGDNSTFSQTLLINDENYILNSLHVSIFDRFGNLLYNGLDYSFTFQIFHE